MFYYQKFLFTTNSADILSSKFNAIIVLDVATFASVYKRELDYSREGALYSGQLND